MNKYEFKINSKTFSVGYIEIDVISSSMDKATDKAIEIIRERFSSEIDGSTYEAERMIAGVYIQWDIAVTD